MSIIWKRLDTLVQTLVDTFWIFLNSEQFVKEFVFSSAFFQDHGCHGHGHCAGPRLLGLVSPQFCVWRPGHVGHVGQGAFAVHSMCIRYVDTHSIRNIMDSMYVREFQTMWIDVNPKHSPTHKNEHIHSSRMLALGCVSFTSAQVVAGYEEGKKPRQLQDVARGHSKRNRRNHNMTRSWWNFARASGCRGLNLLQRKNQRQTVRMQVPSWTSLTGWTGGTQEKHNDNIFFQEHLFQDFSSMRASRYQFYK